MKGIYYISQGNHPEEHLENIQAVCSIGCQFIQLRLKNISHEAYKLYTEKALEICNQYDARLIINDHVEVAKKSNASGVHLGKNDTSPIEARKILGEEKIIGGTANTLDDCIRLANQKVDYIGLGPFRYTTIKKNLSSILGLDGYRKIISEFKKRKSETPVYAIGGIQTGDFQELIKTGIDGIAASGLLTGKTKEEMKQIIEQYNELYSIQYEKLFR